ncbi:MAG: hypothetical protein ACE5MI_13015 [Acidimicrobiia bacterium]
MQQEILDANPEADLAVYAIWMPMLFSDARFRWDPGLLPDSRVVHFWDERRVTGQWFAQEVLGYRGIAWDIFFLYGPEAAWEATPEPLVSRGSTVIGRRDQLQTSILPLLG